MESQEENKLNSGNLGNDERQNIEQRIYNRPTENNFLKTAVFLRSTAMLLGQPKQTAVNSGCMNRTLKNPRCSVF